MKYKVISISLDESAHAALNKRLQSLGMTRSEYVRKLLRESTPARPASATRSATKKRGAQTNLNHA